MSIANKLTYLEETKGLIKEKLNDLGAEITDDTFREYVEKLEEIYRNYPKTIFRGSDITLPIAKKEKIEIFPIGNITQNGGVSPDNPQPIKNVTGNNVVKITLANGEIIEKELNLSGKNLVDKSKCTVGALLVDGTNNGNGTFYTTNYIPVKPNSNYVFSSNYTFTGSAASYCFYDKNKNYISGEAHNNRIGYVINTPSNCYYIKDCFWVGDKSDIDSTFPQLEEGPVATEYEPYYNYELAHTYTANQDWYDYIEGSKDNWKLIKQNKTLKITGSSGFGYYADAGTDSCLYRARHLIPDTVGPTSFGYHYTNLVKCDKFGTTKSNADITTKDIMQVAQNDGRIALFTYITKERLGITDSDTAAQKQQKYRDWFTQNQPEVIYPSTGVEEITITQPTLINQLNELYSMMTTGETITIKTESEEENAQLNLEIRTL